MSDSHVQYLIVGAGAAGDAAVEAIREIDLAGSMMLVGQEINRPYERRQLAGDYLLGKLDHDRLFMHSAAWYGRQHIELCTGRIATHLDTARQMISLDDGSTISFDSLLIATGATPRRFMIPGAELPNIYYPHAIDEADRLRHAAGKSLHEGRGRAVVIGGTLLAIELAATLRRFGLHVEMICAEGHPGGGFLGENAGAVVVRALQGQEIKIISGAYPLRFEGDGRVQRVVLDNGQTVATDLVVAALGVIPNKQILRSTPIRAETAILVDEQGRTNVPGIFAAGECAAIYDPRFGKHRHLLHENSAADVGKLAGRNMAGMSESYLAVNFVERRIFDLDLMAAGEGRLVDHRLVRTGGSEDEPSLVEFGLAVDGRVSQIVSVGKAMDRRILLELIRRRVLLAGNEEAIKDPAFDLSAFLG